MKSFVCVFSLLFSLAAGQDMTVCSATASVGDYTMTFNTHNNSVFFTVSARTDRWVAIGVSDDTMMPDTDIVLGATDGTDMFINDRYATAQAQPPVDTIQDITDTAVTLENGFTTITFTRPRVSEDTTQDISLDQCRYFLWAFNGPVDDFTDPTSIRYHDTNRGNFPNRYCIPDDCVIECPDLDNPVNGAVDDAEREYQSVATYSCNSGFTLDGTMTRTCQSDGTWSGQPPTCVADTDDDGAPVAHSSVMLTSLLAVLGSSLAVFKF